MSIAQFLKNHTCAPHFSDIGTGKYPPVGGDCVICENQALQARLEPFLEQEKERNAFLHAKASAEAEQNRQAAMEADKANRTHQGAMAGEVEKTPIHPPTGAEPLAAEPAMEASDDVTSSESNPGGTAVPGPAMEPAISGPDEKPAGPAPSGG